MTDDKRANSRIVSARRSWLSPEASVELLKCLGYQSMEEYQADHPPGKLDPIELDEEATKEFLEVTGRLQKEIDEGKSRRVVKLIEEAQ